MSQPSLDSFKCRRTLEVGGKTYTYFSLPDAEKNGLPGIARLPFSLKVLLGEPAPLRGRAQRHGGRHPRRASAWLEKRCSDREIAYRPARVLMQDFTGVPAVVDLAAMRDATTHLGADPAKDQSAGAGRPRHRPFGDGRFLRLAQCVRARTSRWNTSGTASATRSCAGARRRSRIFASCRRAPASATR